MTLPDKDRRIVKEHIERLRLYPDITGDIECIRHLQSESRYRMHIGRKYTVFYDVLKDGTLIQVEALMTIKQAHKEYRHLKR